MPLWYAGEVREEWPVVVPIVLRQDTFLEKVEREICPDGKQVFELLENIGVWKPLQR